jgi:hypothetical protein
MHTRGLHIITARRWVSIGDENANCAPPSSHRKKERAMTTRRRFKQSETLEFRLATEAANLRKQAEGLPPGVRRDELLRKARQTEVASHMNDWLSSPGLQPPK